jgi:hypothetical protein
MIRCLSFGWMTRSISLISCKLELHGSDSMQPVGWMTHSICPYCTLLVIVPLVVMHLAQVGESYLKLLKFNACSMEYDNPGRSSKD